jgi:hypothetical protein
LTTLAAASSSNPDQGSHAFRNSVRLKKSEVTDLREEYSRVPAIAGLLKLVMRSRVSTNGPRLGKTMVWVITRREYTMTRNTEEARRLASCLIIISSNAENDLNSQ